MENYYGFRPLTGIPITKPYPLKPAPIAGSKAHLRLKPICSKTFCVFLLSNAAKP